MAVDTSIWAAVGGATSGTARALNVPVPEHSQPRATIPRFWFAFRAHLTVSGTRQRASDSLRQTFRELADRWHEETGFLSSPAQIAMHPAYRRIIRMGDRAIPYILEDLRDRGGQWYWALRAITGASPVPPDASGNARQIKEAWLQWGRDCGYIE